MDIIVATSRGNGLTALRKEKNTKLMVFPGGKIRDMAQAAVNTLCSLPPSQSTNTVYFVSGLPDTTLKLKKKFHMNGRNRFYEEVIINSTAKNIHTHVLKIIKAAEKSIKNANAIPIFSTICPMSIRTWNRHRLSRHRTSHLNHFTKYDHMQSVLEEAITLINTSILSINSKNQVATPKICQPIMYFRKGHLRCRYGKLPDGVHPIPKVNTTWTQTLKTVITRNRASLDKSAPSPQLHTPSSPSPPPPPSSPSPPPPQHQQPDSDSDSDIDPPSPPQYLDSDCDSDVSIKRSWRY